MSAYSSFNMALQKPSVKAVMVLYVSCIVLGTDRGSFIFLLVIALGEAVAEDGAVVPEALDTG